MLRSAMNAICRTLSTILLISLVACAAPRPVEPTPLPPTLTPLPTPLSTTPTAVARPQPTARPTSVPTPPAATPEPTDPLFDPQRISYAHAVDGSVIQAILEARSSPLRTVRFQIGNRSHSFTEQLVVLSSLYSINPLLLLALMDLQSGLVSSSQTGSGQMAWAMGYRGDGGGRSGLSSQLRWAARELRAAVRDYALRDTQALPPLSFADGSRREVSSDIAFSRYVLSRVLAPTTSASQLETRLESLVSRYTQLFGDPRLVPTDWPPLAEPFLTRPMERNFPVTSFFDHATPFLRKSGAILTFWGRDETDSAFAYDGHTGWDYGMGPPDTILAAADGVVTFAGNSDDGCATPARAVIIDHGNGYRSLYWHLHSIAVESGQTVARGEVIGVAGETGCAIGAHLHLQIQYLGRDVDPYGWCGPEPDPWALNPAGQKSVWLWADMPSPCGPPPPNVVVVDDRDPGFLSSGDWQEHPIGYGGGSRFAAVSFAGSAERPYRAASLRAPATVAWRPELPWSGRYRILAYMPYALNGLDESRELRYLIRHADGRESLALVDAEKERNWWADLGTYELSPATALVSLSTLAGDDRRGVWVDAIAFVPVP